MFPRQGSGDLRRPIALCRTPKRSVTGRGARSSSARVDPVLELRSMLDQMEAKRRARALLSPSDRVARSPAPGLGGRAPQTRASIRSVSPPAAPALHLLGVAIHSQPCRSRVSWTKRAPVIDSIPPAPACLLPRLARRGSSGRRVREGGELFDQLALVGEQADVEALSTEIESGVQHVSGPPWSSVGGTTERHTNGGPSSWQSKAAVSEHCESALISD